MERKIEIGLVDGTAIEAAQAHVDEHGYIVLDAHRSDKDGKPVPFAKKVFIPYSAMIYAVLEH